MNAQTGRNGRVGPRDLEVAEWLDRVPGASAEQIRLRFAFGRSQLYRRLQVLRQHGMVRHRHLLAGRPPLYLVGGRSLGPSGYEHALAVSALVVKLERDGLDAFSEVELRRERMEQGSLYGRLNASEGEVVRQCERIPDVAARVPGLGLRAYEVELSSKGRTRREAILMAYAASDYAEVEWVVPDHGLAALLRSEIGAMGLVDFMVVSH